MDRLPSASTRQHRSRQRRTAANPPVPVFPRLIIVDSLDGPPPQRADCIADPRFFEATEHLRLAEREYHQLKQSEPDFAEKVAALQEERQFDHAIRAEQQSGHSRPFSKPATTNWTSEMKQQYYSTMTLLFKKNRQSICLNLPVQAATLPPEQTQATLARYLTEPTPCSLCTQPVRLLSILQPCCHAYCHQCLFEHVAYQNTCHRCNGHIERLLYNIESPTQYAHCPASALDSPTNLAVDFNLQDEPRGSYPRGFVHLLLIKMLATLQAQFPSTEYPIWRLDYATFCSQIPLPVDEALLSAYFRCFIYLHNYRPVRQLTILPSGNSSLATNEYTIRRLVQFIRTELYCLRRAFDIRLIGGSKAIVLDELENLLRCSASLREPSFVEQFVEIVKRCTTLDRVINSYDVARKLLYEVITFAETVYEEHQAYAVRMHYEASRTWPIRPPILPVVGDVIQGSAAIRRSAEEETSAELLPPSKKAKTEAMQ